MHNRLRSFWKKRRNRVKVKDFLFSLDIDKVGDIYFKEYYDVDYRHVEARENGITDYRSHIKDKVEFFMDQLKDIVPIENPDEILWGRAFYDHDIVDDGNGGWNYPLIKIEDVSILCKKDWKTDLELSTIESWADRNDDFHIETYSLMFVEPEYILGLELFNQGNDYRIAAAILHELSWFGYDLEENKKNTEKEKAILDERSKEVENAIENGESEMWHTWEDLRSELGFPEETEDERKDTIKRMEEIGVMNYNLNVWYYKDMNEKVKKYWGL